MYIDTYIYIYIIYNNLIPYYNINNIYIAFIIYIYIYNIYNEYNLYIYTYIYIRLMIVVPG